MPRQFGNGVVQKTKFSLASGNLPFLRRVSDYFANGDCVPRQRMGVRKWMPFTKTGTSSAAKKQNPRL
jgi:hypothetical protein